MLRRSKGDPARTDVPSPGCCHLSHRAALPGDTGLGSCRHTCGLAQPADLEEPAPLLHHCGQTPSVFTLWLPQEAPRVDKALWVTRSPSTRGEDRGRSGASLQEKVTEKPGGSVRSHAGTRQVPNPVTARCAQRRAPPAARCAGNWLCQQLAARPRF